LAVDQGTAESGVEDERRHQTTAGQEQVATAAEAIFYRLLLLTGEMDLGTIVDDRWPSNN